MTALGLARMGADNTAGATPAPAVVVSDFKNGVYSIGGVSKTLAQVWEAHPDYNPFDASLVVADTGFTVTGTNGSSMDKGPALTTAAATGLLSGFVVVIDYICSHSDVAGGQVGFDLYLADLPNFNKAWFLSATAAGATERVEVRDFGALAAGSTNGDVILGAHRLAARFSPTSLALAVDAGGISDTLAPQALEPATNIVFSASGATTGGRTATVTIEKIEFFSLDDYTANDLQTLSAP